MKQIIVFLVLSVIMGRLSAQKDNCNCQSNDAYAVSIQRGLIGREYLNPLRGFKGERFFGAWAKGEVKLNNGETIIGIDLRYERYLDELLWLRDGDFKSGILHKSEIAGFVLFKPGMNPAVFVKRRIKLSTDKDSIDRYLQELENGEIKLYAYRKVVQSPNEFKLSDDTKYILFKEGMSELLALKRKNLLALAAIDKNKMKDVFRSGKIRVNRSEPGMIRAIEAYNQKQ